MSKISRLDWLGIGLAALILTSCAATDRKEDLQSPVSSLALPPVREAQVTSEPSPPPPPPPLLPLKKPQGTLELESLVSLTVTEGSLKEVLQALTEQAGVNLIIDRDVVDENATINIKNLPLWQALDALLTAHNLFYATQPGYIKVSRMMTRVFHLDYVRTLRAGLSTTQVSLSSGSNGGDSTGGTTGSTSGGSSGTQGATTLGALGGGSAAGDITVQSLEIIDFWKDFDSNLKQIMRDPLYEILRTEYDQKDLRRNLTMIPYEEEYEKEVMQHRLEMFRLQREMMQKQLETGVTEGTVAAPSMEQGGETRGNETRGQGQENQGTQGTGTETANLVGTYSLDPQTGTLVVTTTPEVMARVESFLSQLRQNLNLQVYIDVQILEVSLGKDRQMGIDWGSFPGLLQYYRMPQLRDVIEQQMLQQAESGGGGGGSSTGGQGVTSPISSNPFSTSPEGSFQLGVLSTLGNHQALQYSLNTVLSFLEEQGTVKAVSRPQITTLNNQPAVVSVGVNDFYATFEQQTTSAEGGLATSSVSSRLNPIFIGVTLSITPQISPEGEIAMKIVPAINKMIGQKSVPTGIPSAPTQTIPVLETRQTSTMVRVRESETIIISGLIQESDDTVEKEVPYFSDIPVVGKVFRHSAHEKKSSELVMLLTPRIPQRPLQMEEAGFRELSGGR